MCIPGLFGGMPDAPDPPGPAPAPPVEAAKPPISGHARRKKSMMDLNAGSLVIPPNLNIP